MHKVRATRKTKKWWRFAYRGGRKWRYKVAERRSSGEQIREPGGEIRRGSRGQMKRREWGLRGTRWEGEGMRH